MSAPIQQRVLAVAERRIEGFVMEKITSLTGDDEELQQARKQEKQARAKALARAAADSESATTQPTEDSTSPTAIDQLAAGEDCPICTSILEAIKDFEEPRRTKGVAEYGEFRSAIEDSEEAAEAVLEGSDVLVDALSNVSEVPT